MRFLNDNNVVLIVWPPNSPDLNPIENIWGIIKAKLRYLDCSTRAKLIAHVKRLWNEITNDLWDKLARSMPRRIQECMARNGASTKY